MTPSQAKALLPIITAFADGEAIQFALAKDYPWHDCYDPHFDDPSVWRIKPTAKCRPWKFEEVPIGKVIKTVDGRVRVLIARCEIGSGLIYLSGQNHALYALEIFTEYTMDDGSPCGTLV